MKKKVLLPILLLATMTLVGCNNNPPAKSSAPDASASEPVEPTEYGVAIANKEALQGEWYANTTRDLDVTLTPAANPLTELGKNLSVTSSDPEVVAVTGLGLKSLKAGRATITVKYHEATDTVDVTILDNSAKAKYGVAHEGTAADPFTNEDALVVAKHEKYEGEVYYVKGIVDRFYYAPGTNANNGTAYYLKAATEGGEQFEIFKCFKADGSQLSDDDIWVGGEATAYGAFTKYNTQYETSSAVFVSCTGNKPQPRQTLAKSFAETLAAGVALKDGETTWDYYKFQGYVTVKSGNDYFLTAAKGEALTPGKSDKDHGERDIKGTNAIELYGAGKVAELAAKLLENAKVEVTMLVKNYHGTVENGKDLVDADVTVLEAGTNWAVPEPAVSPKTLAEFIAAENTKTVAYNVTATVKSWKNATAEKDKYGNMILTDGTNDLVIYGSSATATALAWDNASAYAFTNPQDFLTNEVTAALNIGDEITMKLIRADYNGAVQGTGIITKVTPAGAPEVSLSVATDIAVGDKLIMSVETEKDGNPVKKQFNGIITAGSNKIGEAVDYAGDKPAADVQVLDVVAGSNANTFALKAGEQYLVWKSGNTLDSQDAVDANASWSFTFADGKATIVNAADNNRKLQYNASSPRFCAYTSAQTAVTLWKITTGEGGQTPANAYPTFKWSDAIQEGSAALDGTKFNKNATYNLKVENVPAAGNYTITLPMMGSDGNGSKTINGSGQDFTISANDVAGTILVAGKSYTEVFGEDQKAWVDVVFAEVALVEGSNLITLKTGNGGYRVSVKADGNVTLAEAAAQQQEVAQPVGSFSGYAVNAQDDSNIFVDIALADSKAFVEVGSLLKTTVDFAFDKTTGVVTIALGGNFGNLTATYDETNNKLTNVGVDGAAAAMLKNNGSMELVAAAKFWDCNGTTEELQAMFKRRYMSGSWQVDSSNADRFVSYENGICGKAMQRRGYSGGAVAVNLAADMDPVEVSNIGFWVYNPGASDLTLRMWIYKGAGLTSNAELGNVTAVAGQWTYCRMGFTKASIYNFQIADFNNSGVALVFDNIVLF